jgi:formylglycine-generating enzyme required for sulfatase activity
MRRVVSYFASVICLFAAPVIAVPPLVQVPFDAQRARELQVEWAKTLGANREITNSLEMKLVLIPPGRFTLGPNGSTYRVLLAKPFYMATTEVTLSQYRRWKPHHAVEHAAPEFNADDRPAAMVSWDDARAFCKWLSELPDEKRAGRLLRRN